jgi:hypothetical protein
MPNRKALNLIVEERIRQTLAEGYTPAHDDEHTEGQLALLAAAYALTSRGEGYEWIKKQVGALLRAYDFDLKPADPIRDLTRAGALILAELERRLRAESFVSITTKEDLDREGA